MDLFRVLFRGNWTITNDWKNIQFSQFSNNFKHCIGTLFGQFQAMRKCSNIRRFELYMRVYRNYETCEIQSDHCMIILLTHDMLSIKMSRKSRIGFIFLIRTKKKNLNLTVSRSTLISFFHLVEFLHQKKFLALLELPYIIPTNYELTIVFQISVVLVVNVAMGNISLK